MPTAVATSTDPTVRPARAPRVVVLDDDAVFRAVLSRLLVKAGAEVVATCSTIESARKRLAGGDVDAVTVDVVLRNESGLDFLKWCRAAHPSVMTVLVTAGTEKGARTGVDAVFLGAAALLTKPEAKNLGEFEAELRRLFPESRTAPVVEPQVRVFGPRLRPEPRRELLAVGASTGGPPALLKFLKGLPPTFDVPIVITQHMPALHLTYLAELLSQQGGRPVELAADQAPLVRGRAYLAGYGKHLQVARVDGRLVTRQFDGPPEHYCKPAVDPMFRSVAQACKGTSVGVVLTGMGQDGSRGAVALREAGNPVLVQDEASSVVWGMPSAVVAAAAADLVASIDQLPQAVLEWMAWPQGGTR